MRKHRLLRTSFVAGAGAAAMYYADPEQGPLRRALLRQRFTLFKDRAEEMIVDEPLSTAEAMLDLRDVDADATAASGVDVTIIEVIDPAGESMDLPEREPISPETMTIDEAIFHAARTS
jgi:hypothetical protein